ncbi:glycosyltransferase family 25 protein [Primorskyibacter aestuariivivens]|uniref:glycosyltransferase family 25 protein n=1 Tax=Primorskyibacter aestuariivivens TaxID=1888912 RepID=UPI002301D6E0|nr:glycosyltransferase family 25 protein [Primorskyibacter aestuariivivens]MDA7429599.1 glycosyltransferase family 25 protein [Primorskyibacter aestuariivivens]
MATTDTFRSIFDYVYVVSLPASHDRRTYVAKHLNAAGIEDFTFHDACDATDPRVRDFIGSDRVHSYPPCFRCGKLSCGRDDCNNVLIPAQIATFVTYLELWKKVSARPQFSLVVEDDVELNPYWPEVLRKLADAKNAAQLDLSPGVPRLLRLGWARNDEHDGAIPFRIGRELRMSNPCHALTSAFARALLDRFEKIDTTVDIFMHKIAPKPGEALTVFPPLASELSWSKGAFESLIHPKPIRAEFLQQQGLAEEAQDALDRAERHSRTVAHLKLNRG